jgi:protein-tyrosine phosphatase
MKILMVCLGNICRSPLAEGILKDKLKKNNLAVEVDSAGTSSYHSGDEPDSRTLDVARKHDIDISKHRGQQITSKDFANYDKIYTMDAANYRNVLNLAHTENDRAKVQMILNVTNPGKNHEVPDPYYSGNDGFEVVYNMLDEACEIIVESLKNKNCLP